MTAAVLEVKNLRLELVSGGPAVATDISFAVEAGEVLGLVGESGSGKTTVALAVLAHCRPGLRITNGTVTIAGDDMLTMGPAALRRARGNVVSYVAQDAATALNPALRLGRQLREVLTTHRWPSGDVESRMRSVLADVKLPSDQSFLSKYPHQLSGGQQQRLVLAMAFACRPQVIILDEPTTALDVTTQGHILETIRELCRTYGSACVFVSHDMAVVGSISDDIAVMYAGRLVELGPSEDILGRPAHPYTRRLIGAIPDPLLRRTLVGIPGRAPTVHARPSGGCQFRNRCAYATPQCALDAGRVQISDHHYAMCWRSVEILKEGPLVPAAISDSDGGTQELLTVRELSASYGPKQILQELSFEIREGECLALVGESGSGKTTLARSLVGLHVEATGNVTFRGRGLPFGLKSRSTDVRSQIQYVFQNPYDSLNPRRTIGQSIAQPLKALKGIRGRAAAARIDDALATVSLDPTYRDRYPAQLSGGERQRAAIARALVAEPALLICDEVTSALDVSVQAALVELLRRLEQEAGVALLFVTHNLALVRSLADHVAVMYDGSIVEYGRADDVLSTPQEAYTKELIASAPRLELA